MSRRDVPDAEEALADRLPGSKHQVDDGRNDEDDDDLGGADGEGVQVHIRILRFGSRSGSRNYRSMASATPLPPPRHRLAIPRFNPRCSSAYSNVVRMRAPLAPIGCPSATAPPWTLTLAGSIPSCCST